jgi:hypothetical protein
MSLSFVDGIRIFSRAFARCWIEPDLRQWFFKTLAATFVMALVLIAGLFALGAWAFASYFEQAWSTTVAILLWVLVLFYVSGHVATLLLSSLVLIVGGETALTRFYFRNLTSLPSAEIREGMRLKFKDRSREVIAMLKSLLVAFVAWPLLLIPFLMPVGVLVFAWAMAGDVLAIGRRLCHEHGREALQDQEKLSLGATIGLAVLPSSMALFPVLGWALLPVLQAAALEMQLTREIRRIET